MTDAERLETEKESALVEILRAIERALIAFGPDAILAYDLHRAEQAIEKARRELTDAWGV